MSIFKTISSLASSTLSVADTIDQHIKCWSITSSLELQVEFGKDLARAIEQINSTLPDQSKKINSADEAMQAIKDFRAMLRSL